LDVKGSGKSIMAPITQNMVTFVPASLEKSLMHQRYTIITAPLNPWSHFNQHSQTSYQHVYFSNQLFRERLLLHSLNAPDLNMASHFQGHRRPSSDAVNRDAVKARTHQRFLYEYFNDYAFAYSKPVLTALTAKAEKVIDKNHCNVLQQKVVLDTHSRFTSQKNILQRHDLKSEI
jgi:hypothetical protein